MKQLRQRGEEPRREERERAVRFRKKGRWEVVFKTFISRGAHHTTLYPVSFSHKSNLSRSDRDPRKSLDFPQSFPPNPLISHPRSPSFPGLTIRPKDAGLRTKTAGCRYTRIRWREEQPTEKGGEGFGLAPGIFPHNCRGPPGLALVPGEWRMRWGSLDGMVGWVWFSAHRMLRDT